MEMAAASFALMPVNGLTVFGKQEVMSADEAAQLTRALHARVAVPTHYAYRGGRIKEVACLAHVRRKFFDIHLAQGSAIAKEALERIAELYRVDDAVRG